MAKGSFGRQSVDLTLESGVAGKAMQEKHGAAYRDFGINMFFNVCLPRWFLQASAWVYVLCFF